MKILLLILLLTPCFTDSFFITAEDKQEKVEKKKKSSKKSNVKTGGRFYKQSNIKLANSDSAATFDGTSYQAVLDAKGVIHLFLKSGDVVDKKPAILAEVMWEDGKDKKAHESLLTAMDFKEKNPEEWQLTGTFGDIKGEFEMNVSLKGESIVIQCDASAKKQGDLKITFTVTNLSALYKKNDDKTTKAAKEAFFVATTTKNKALKTDYNLGKLKETASEKRRKGAFPKKAEPDTKKVTV